MERLENLTSEARFRRMNISIPIPKPYTENLESKDGFKQILVKSLESRLSPEQLETSINVVFVGKTGNGKTTMINAAVNHLLGVKYKDNFRYVLVQEPFTETTSQSMTKNVHKYYVYSTTLKVLFCLIDTPGFADTGGKDSSILEMIQDLFLNIESLSAIIFTQTVGEVRMTSEQLSVWEQVTSVFGNEV